MTIHIHNVLTGKKEPFKPNQDSKVGIYVCGVTVYGRCHVGHLRCYLSFDAILRYFAYKGMEVTYVRNFTDIDDKIIARAKEIEAGPQGAWRNQPAYADYDDTQWAIRLAEDAAILERAKKTDAHLATVVSDHFIDIFTNEDFAPFDLFPAAAQPRVSQHIDAVIELIGKIIENGFAYQADGDVYFDVPAYHSKTGAYGKLSGRDFTQMLGGARVAPGDKKRNPADFALWKKAAKGEPAWPSPFGEGRPGWHIECSAMSEKELGCPFDIHGGGKDLIFPHHENEIAQAEAAGHHPFCNTWMHNGFVTVNGVKMSKSLGNFITIEQALTMAPPEVWRMVVLSSHYASPIDFSQTKARDESGEVIRGTLDIAYDRLEYFYETLARADQTAAGQPLETDVPLLDDLRVNELRPRFEEAMDDDFNTAKAMAAIGESLKFINELCDMKGKQVKKLPGGRPALQKTLRYLASEVRAVCAVFNLCQKPPQEALSQMRTFQAKVMGIDESFVDQQISLRQAARAHKDFAKSDLIRDRLLAQGVLLQDGPSGTTWKVVRG